MTEEGAPARRARPLRVWRVVRRRFMWWAPWGTTRWWLPRWFMGGDEWCNVPLCVNVPPLGCFIFFKPWGVLRTLPCAVDWQAMSSDQQADYAPCGWLHDERIRPAAHHHMIMRDTCSAAQRWLESKTESEDDARE